MGDYPSLRDLETSNAFTRSNVNLTQARRELQTQIMLDPKRKKHLEEITAKLSSKPILSFTSDICQST